MFLNPFEHGEVINYTQLLERKETTQGFLHEANGDFKTLTEFNGCDRRKQRMDQQHCCSLQRVGLVFLLSAVRYSHNKLTVVNLNSKIYCIVVVYSHLSLHEKLS